MQHLRRKETVLGAGGRTSRLFFPAQIKPHVQENPENSTPILSRQHIPVLSFVDTKRTLFPQNRRYARAA